MTDFFIKTIPVPVPRPEVPIPSEPPSPILPPVPEPVVHTPETVAYPPAPEVILPPDRVYEPITDLPDIWSHKNIGLDYWKEIYNNGINYPYELYESVAPWLNKDISENSLLDIGILTMVLGIGVTLAVLTR
jgi:hypothetical protein